MYHIISYAYPTSNAAKLAGVVNSGAFVFSIPGKHIPFATYKEAVQHAKNQATEPSRWSMDHPKNLHLLADHHKE